MAQGKVGSDTRVCGFLCFYEQLTETENKRLTSPQGEQSTVSIWHVISSSIMATAPPPPPVLPTCLCFLPKKGKYHFDSQLTGQNLSCCSQCLILTLTSACPCVCVSVPGERPFQCQYCPYSASQKGNLKTHVQTVHRLTFDNAQYPDRRLHHAPSVDHTHPSSPGSSHRATTS